MVSCSNLDSRGLNGSLPETWSQLSQVRVVLCLKAAMARLAVSSTISFTSAAIIVYLLPKYVLIKLLQALLTHKPCIDDVVLVHKCLKSCFAKSGFGDVAIRLAILV